MATRQITWAGTERESQELLEAIARNCACVRDEDNVCVDVCASHRLLVTDQRALDGLLFARRMSDRLRLEEFSRDRIAAAL